MKISETTKDKFEAVVQRYIGMKPGDVKCDSWGEMQRQMAGELLEVLEGRPEEMYYIQNGYVGNAILWWREDSQGYTAHFHKAGRYPKDKAIQIVNDSLRGSAVAWLCSHVDNNTEAQVLTVEVGNLDRTFQITKPKDD